MLVEFSSLETSILNMIQLLNTRIRQCCLRFSYFIRSNQTEGLGKGRSVQTV